MTRLHVRVRWAPVLGWATAMTLIFGLAGTPPSAFAASDPHRGYIQEALGQAIVLATRATSPHEKAQAQELLGRLISQAAPVGVEEKAMAPLHVRNTVPPERMETRGEPIFWIFASFGGTLMLLLSFFGARTDPAPKHPGDVVGAHGIHPQPSMA
jgi:hypothetical protein